MSVPADEPIPVILVPPPARKGQTLLAWIAIILTLAAILGLRSFVPSSAAEQRAAVTEQRLNLVVLEMQMRYLVGSKQFYLVMGEHPPVDDLCEQARKFAGGAVEARLCAAAVIGDVCGPEAALHELRGVAQEMSAEQRSLHDILVQVYQDYSVGRYDLPSVTPGRRLLLSDRLGWFGALALHPEGPLRNPEVLGAAAGPAALALEPGRFVAPGRSDVLAPALRTFLVCAIASVLILCALAAGFVALTLFSIWAARGGVHWGLTCGTGSHAGVYAETFALWLIGYSGLSLLGGLLPDTMPFLARAASAMLLSLLILGWPVVRGIPWRQVRADIGWAPGRRTAAMEVAAGAVSYVVNLPLVLLGLLVTLLLVMGQNLFGAGGEGQGETPLPTHPLLQFMSSTDWQNLLVMFLLAGLIAPVVEETFFRGVLYRHLRELTSGLGRWGSATISALVVSFIFAIIHPQGIAAVPVLMALACGFCLAREWRNTLLGAVFAHGLNNTMVTIFALSALGR